MEGFLFFLLLLGVTTKATYAVCNNGYFGDNCGYTCHCSSPKECHQISGICQGPCTTDWEGTECQLGNAALDKNAKQYPPYRITDDKQNGPLQAGKAVDGDVSTGDYRQCTHTDDKATGKYQNVMPWWRVDLGKKFVLFSVTLYNRYCPGCGDRLKNFKIWMTDSDVADDADPSPDDAKICTYFQGAVGHGASQEFTCVKPVIGRYMFIKIMDVRGILTLCEVKVKALQYRACPGGQYWVNCYKEYPYMKRPPVLTTVTSFSMTVTSPTWDITKDGGEGPVLMYRLQHKAKEATQWTDWKDLTPAALSASLTGLNADAEYSFRVILESSPWFNGPAAFGKPGISETYRVCPGTITPKISVTSSGIDTSKSLPHRAYISGTIEIEPDHTAPGCISVYQVSIDNMTDTDGYKVVQSPKNNGTFRLDHLNADTTYNIKVEIDTSDGYKASSQPTAKKTPQDIPGMVTNLASVKHQQTLRITWGQPDIRNGAITGYYVDHKLVAYGDCQTVNNRGYINSTRITGLSLYDLPSGTVCAYCHYDVIVRAATSAGKGMSKILKKQLTAGQVPQTAPPTPSVSSLMSRSASFNWGVMPCNMRNGPETKYQYNLKTTAGKTIKSEKTSSTGISINNLIPYTTYFFKTAFHNGVGLGPYNKGITVTTKEERPPPPKISKAGAAPDSISVKLIPPDPPFGKITKYTIEMWKTGQQGSSMVSKETTSTVYTFRNLTVNTNYKIKAKAWTKIGDGSWSSEINITTEEGKPGKPASFKTGEKTQKALLLLWSEPQFKNGKLKDYKVLCVVLSSYDPEVDKAKEANRKENQPGPAITALEVTNLTPATHYNCTIFAQTSKGYGPGVSVTAWTEPPTEPDFKEEWFPKVTSSGNENTIAIEIGTISKKTKTGKTVGYRIGVEKLSKKRRKRSVPVAAKQHSKLTDYKSAKANGSSSYIAAQLAANFSGKFTIGDNKTHGGYYNPPLENGQKYDILFGIITDAGGVKRVAYRKLGRGISVGAASSLPIIIGVVVSLLIIIIIVVVVVVVVLRRKRPAHMNKPPVIEEELQPVSGIRNEGGLGNEGGSGNEGGLAIEGEDGLEYEDVSTPAFNKYEILCTDLLKYVTKMKALGEEGFNKEYEEFPKDIVKAATVGQSTKNIEFNRYRNIIAYDNSRVILAPVGDEKSDYINANYIDGYKVKKAYIASQGPTVRTKTDMMRMIWQEKCSVIVMVTNLQEGIKIKCEQYWPSEGGTDIGPFHIELDDEVTYTDYCRRDMTIRLGTQSHKVKQFHFTAWPDHGVPQFASVLLNFRSSVIKEVQYGKSPILVHCSAGVGRTGTFIAIDYLIRKGREEKKVNIFECVHNLRAKRPNMVQNTGQYMHVYDAMVEYFKIGLTIIPSERFAQKFQGMTTVNPGKSTCYLQQQFMLLNTTAKTNNATASLPTTDSRDRNENIVPNDLTRPLLSIPVKGWGDYINAANIEGYGDKNKYTVTQMPLPNTIKDIWRLVDDANISTIVMMNHVPENDEYFPIYWPAKDSQVKHGPLLIEGLSEDTSNMEIRVRDFKLTRLPNAKGSGSQPARQIRHFQLLSWKNGDPVPASPKSIVDLLGMMETWQRTSGNTKLIVQCMDGAFQSGVFCAAHSVIEKVKIDHEVDVFKYVRLIRVNRSELVANYEQYKFIHEVVLAYLQGFDIYDNFQ